MSSSRTSAEIGYRRYTYVRVLLFGIATLPPLSSTVYTILILILVLILLCPTTPTLHPIPLGGGQDVHGRDWLSQCSLPQGKSVALQASRGVRVDVMESEARLPFNHRVQKCGGLSSSTVLRLYSSSWRSWSTAERWAASQSWVVSSFKNRLGIVRTTTLILRCLSRDRTYTKVAVWNFLDFAFLFPLRKLQTASDCFWYHREPFWPASAACHRWTSWCRR